MKFAVGFNMSNFQAGQLTGNLSEWKYNDVFGTYGVQLNSQVNPFKGLWFAVDYWLDLLNECAHLLALELKVASPTHMLHMVDVFWTSLKHILHIMEILEESLAPDLAQMLVKSDEIMARGWWGHLQNNPEIQMSASKFCEQHSDDSGSDDESDSEAESENESEDEAEAEDQFYADCLSGQNTPIGSDDNMSIGSDDGMSMQDDVMAIGGDQYIPDSKTLLDWIIVYVYIKNEGDMKDLLKKMNDQLGKTMQKLIDKCLFDVK